MGRCGVIYPMRKAGLLLFALALLFGCGPKDIHLAAEKTPLTLDQLEQNASRIRGLSFQDKVSLRSRSRNELQALLEKSFLEDYGNETLKQMARVYLRLGLLSQPTDLLKAMVELRLFHQPVYYDPPRRAIVAPEGRWEPGPIFSRSPWRGEKSTIEIIFAHALAHALQEQNFHIRERARVRNTEDFGLAFRALIEGDATLVGLIQMQGALPKERVIEELKESLPSVAEIEGAPSDLPGLLRQRAAFEYVQGARFVLWAYSLKGWEGVNSLFLDPPLSSAQLLHPEKYFADKKLPVQIRPWGLIRQMEGRKIIDETLGEFHIRFLLEQSLSKKEAADAAAGWAGDSLLAFEQKGELVLGWITAWENDKEALEFFTHYRRALEKRHGVALETAPADGDSLTAPAQGDLSLLLQKRGRFVLFLDGFKPPRSLEVAEEVWKDLEIETEPLQIPFDLARSTGQLSPARR